MMKTHLLALELWEAVSPSKEAASTGAAVKIEEGKKAVTEVKKYRALSIIQSSVTKEVFSRIMTCNTPKQAWETLRAEFAGNEKTRKGTLVNLRREFENLKMGENEPVRKYANRVTTVVNKIRLLGDTKYPEQRVVEKIINTLPIKYEFTISSIENSGRDIDEITLNDLLNALYSLEQRRYSEEPVKTEGAFAARGSEKGKKKWQNDSKKKKGKADEDKNGDRKEYPPCTHCKKTTHSAKFCWYRPDAFCKNCQQKGHSERVCKNKEGKKMQAQVAEQAGEHEEQDETLFVATCYVSSKNQSTTWLIDSGCSHHMVADEAMFSYLDRTYTNKVKIGDGKLLKATGKGDVEVQTLSGTKIIPEVLLVPEISHNLISVGQLLEKDFALMFKNKSCIIYEPAGLELVTLPMVNKTFFLKIEEENALTSTVDDSALWHKRLGHANYLYLSQR